ncbi:MAG TPA: hypothetical protein DER40_12845 [Geobacter sp.]|nr:MAG: hypothetical protein A2X85_12815 [Geobacteraceae bacterium GWF2_54_21]HBA71103.1 hypothetical protein [Geobacter sp.]HCE68356.1 hypothetical protein [Geobacter sp.]
MIKVILFWICLYLLILIFSFISEITYKKRTIEEVRKNLKQIVIQTSLTFAVFVVASYLWSKYGGSGR